MQTFKLGDRDWFIDLTIDVARRLKATPIGEDQVKVDLLKLWDGTPPMIQRLTADLWLQVDVLFLVSRPRDGSPLTDEEFAAALGPDGFKAASEAFWADLQDFYQRLGQTHLAEAVAANRELILAGLGVVRKLVRHLETAGVETLADLTETPPSTSGTGSGSPPDSWESIRPG